MAAVWTGKPIRERGNKAIFRIRSSIMLTFFRPFLRVDAMPSCQMTSGGIFMQGKVLAFDFRTSEGEISGNDGHRYSFSGAEWKQPKPPKAGQLIDFQSEGGRAMAIYSVAGSTSNSSEKNRIVAALLAFFLGGLGIHKFYLGKSTAGLIMLLCSVFGIILVFIPTIIIGIIAFIEFIIYLMISDEDFEDRYVQGDKAWF